MDLSDKLLNDFANLFRNMNEKKQIAIELYGEVVEDGGKKFVSIDGSKGNLTPLSKATDCEVGDRILVRIQNHEAVAIGNMTSPASARTATNYLKETTDNQGQNAIMVGELVNGKPQGMYLLITSEGLLICDDGGSTVKAKISYENDILYVMGRNTVGIRAQNANKEYHAEMICSMDNNNPKVALQAWRSGYSDSKTTIIGSYDGISMETPRLEHGVGRKPVTINGYQILSSSNSVVFGSTSLKNMYVDAQNVRNYVLSITNMPEGYTLTGIRSIHLSNNNVTLYQYSLNPINNTISMKISGNASKGYNVDIDLEWFAILSGNVKVLEQDIIDLDDGGDDDG